MAAKESFVRVASLDEVKREGRKAVKVNGRGVVLFYANGAVYACDNACPHEGYPLAQGEIVERGGECVLTCVWHNWKFALPSGQCVMGGEDVRAYAVNIEGDDVWLDMTAPDPEREKEKCFKSLRKGLVKAKMGRLARDTMRLLRWGASPAEVLRETLRHGAAVAEEGFDHGLCAAVDAAHAFALYAGDEIALPLMQAHAAVAEGNVRREPRQTPAPADVSAFASPGAVLPALRRLVEEEKADEAEALFKGALSLLSREEAERWLVMLATDHFLDYGHAPIYALKCFEALDVVGAGEAPRLMPGLVAAFTLATREDKLPYMHEMAAFITSVSEAEWARLAAKEDESAAFDETAFCAAMLGNDARASTRALMAALERGVPSARLASALALCGAERMLAFDISVETDPKNPDGWLDVTHALTHASAVRMLWKRTREPLLFRALFHQAHLLHHVRSWMAAPSEMASFRFHVSSAEEYLAALEEARLRREADRAAALAEGYLAAGYSPDKLGEWFVRRSLDDPAAKPITVAHFIKTARAAVREFEASASPRRGMFYAALARFFASPLRERGVVQSAWKGITFVRKVG